LQLQDLDTSRTDALANKWLGATQQALRLVSEKSPQPTSVKDWMDHLGIEVGLVQYNEDEDEFDEP
jgi:hypothetical protein